MKVTVEKIDDINIILSGKIANHIVEERFATRKEEVDSLKTAEKVQEEVESAILDEFIEEGLKVANVDVKDVLGQPGFRKYEKQGDDIYYEIELSTAPSIDVSIDYSDTIPSYTQPEITSSEVDAQLELIAQEQSSPTKVQEDRAVKNGDVTVIDFEGFIGKDPFEGGKAENFKLKIGSNSFIPGFEEQIIGMKANEEKSITVTFPKDYASPDLAGKESTFKIKLHEIQEQLQLSLDDGLAKKLLNKEDATLEMLKITLKEQMQVQALSELYRNELKLKFTQALLAKFNFTLPNNIVEQEIDTIVHEMVQNMSEEEVAEQKDDKEKFHQLRDSVREEAKASIKMALLVEALAEKENVSVDDEQAIAALNYQASVTGQDAGELVKYYQDNNLLHSVRIRLTEDKLLRKLLGL